MKTKPIYKQSIVDLLKLSLVFFVVMAIGTSVNVYDSYESKWSYTVLYGERPSLMPYLIAMWLCAAGGGLFIFLGLLFVQKFREKNVCHLREEIEKVREIVCDGNASYSNGGFPAVGWLFLSVDALEFYPGKGNGSNNCVAVLLDDIENVEVHGKKLIIHTKSESIKFKVYKAMLWKEHITKTL